MTLLIVILFIGLTSLYIGFSGINIPKYHKLKLYKKIKSKIKMPVGLVNVSSNIKLPAKLNNLVVKKSELLVNETLV